MHYQPYYCEENAWWLCADSALGPESGREVAFISNPRRAVVLCQQRAGGPSGVVIWDYHVICLTHPSAGSGWKVWDLDTTLGMPVPAVEYLDATFPATTPQELWPSFRVMPAEVYRRTLSTDRSHMRDPDKGGWLHPPPDWAPPQLPGVRHNLGKFIDTEGAFEGEVLDLAALRARCG